MDVKEIDILFKNVEQNAKEIFKKHGLIYRRCAYGSMRNSKHIEIEIPTKGNKNLIAELVRNGWESYGKRKRQPFGYPEYYSGYEFYTTLEYEIIEN
jgi:hypothetical protein